MAEDAWNSRDPSAGDPRHDHLRQGRDLRGTVPMGGVIVRKHIYDAFMGGPDNVIELFHGYTYSGHPLAAAAALASLDIYREEGLFERTRAMEGAWADAVMSLKGEPNVVDIRTLASSARSISARARKAAGKRGYEFIERAFHEEGLMIRTAADTIASPPLIISESQVDELIGKLRRVIRSVAN